MVRTTGQSPGRMAWSSMGVSLHGEQLSSFILHHPLARVA
jgi:hypothetical protein